MDILKAFSINDKEYPINIQGTMDDPLFQANQIASLLGIKSLNNNLLTFDESEKLTTKSHTPGGIQNVTFLTERGLIRILGRSNKPIAQKFQKWMTDVIQELRRNGIVRLKEEHEIEYQLIRAQEKKKSEKDIHNTLITVFDKKNVVYMCRLREEDVNGQFIIKIGSSQHIKSRLGGIASDYQTTPVLLHVVECDNHTKLESHIRGHDNMKPLLHEIKKKDNTSARETFLVNHDQCKDIAQFIQTESKQFITNDIETEIKRNEIDKERHQRTMELEHIRIIEDETRMKHEITCMEYNLKMQEYNIRTQELKLLNLTNTIIQSSDVQPSAYCSEASDVGSPEPTSNNSVFVRTRNNVRSPKVYQYDPVTLDLIQIYDSIITFIRHFHSSSACALKEAAKHCKTYKGFRWMLVDRNATEDPVVEPTVESKTYSIEYIAMIDIKQTRILEVFPSQKEAAMARNLSGFSTISRAIKKNSISSGHYWQLYRLCSPEMRDAYLQDHTLPEPHVKSNGTTVQQLHPITGDIVQSYPSIMEVQKHFQMSRTTLYIASNQHTVHHGFKWNIMTPTEEDQKSDCRRQVDLCRRL